MRVGLAFGDGIASTRTSNAAAGPFRSKAASTRGWSSPKVDDLRAQAEQPERRDGTSPGASALAVRFAAGPPSASISAIASALAAKTSGAGGLPVQARAGSPARRPVAASDCWPGSAPKNCGPISNSAAGEIPRAALRDAAWSSEGRTLGRIASRSAEIGFATSTTALPVAPKSAAWAFGTNEYETHSTSPRDASARRASALRRWPASSARRG